MRIGDYAKHLPSGSPPLHVGLLPDGARRWAIQEDVSLQYSYCASANRLCDLILFMFNNRVNEVSILISNIQNHCRNIRDVEGMIIGVNEFISQLRKLRFSGENFAKNVFVGAHADQNGQYFRINSEIQKTKVESQYKVNVLIGYDPFEELDKAIVASQSETGDPRNYLDFLCVSRPIDLVIRTGGYNLLSNFLPLRTGYARIKCIDVLFNDMTEKILGDILDEFFLSDRIYGI